MKYFKNKTGDVYAYTEQDLEVVNGIAELSQTVTAAQQDFDALVEPQEPEPIALAEGEEGYEQAQAEYDDALDAYKDEQQAYDTAKNALAEAQNALDSVLPVFFGIREKLKNMVELTGAELEVHLNPKPTDEQLAEQARFRRDRLLSESDWTQVPDAPVDQVAWADYRQALRDVPEQEGFPENVEWPESRTN